MFIVEGNIGAGKSTFLELIAQAAPDIKVALEPVNNWQKNVYGQSLLANFYEQPKRWAYTLETFAMVCRVREHLKDQAEANQLCLIERSIFSGHYVFAHNGYQQGFMSDLEWHLYSQWFDMMTRPCRPPLGFIYLRVDPEIAFARLKKRNRLAEKKITLAYLRQIHERHEQLLVHKTASHQLAKVPVLVLDCNQEFQHNTAQFNEHLAKVREFMQQQIVGLSSEATMDSRACL